MAKKASARKPASKSIPSRGAGRPVTIGATAFIGTKWPPATVERVDAWAETVGVGRSEALRRLVELGLAKAAKR
jgi:hypothetical protein